MFKKTIIILLIPCLLIACGDDDSGKENPPELDCKVNTLSILGQSTGDEQYSFEYFNGEQNQFSKITGLEKSYHFNPTANQIIFSVYNNDTADLEEQSVFQLNNENLPISVEKEFYDSGGNVIQTSSGSFTYNSNDEMTEYEVDETLLEFVWENGNVVEVIQNGNAVIELDYYEEYENQEFIPNRLHFIIQNGHPLWNEANTNLPKSQTVLSSGSVRNYDYEFDENGMVTDVIVTFSDVSDQLVYRNTYDCN